MPGKNRAFETKKGPPGHRSRIPANANAQPKVKLTISAGCFAQLRDYAFVHACAYKRVRSHNVHNILVVHAIVCHSQVPAKYARPFVSDLLFWNRRHSTLAANRIKCFWFVLPLLLSVPILYLTPVGFPRPNGKHENFGTRDQAAVTAATRRM